MNYPDRFKWILIGAAFLVLISLLVFPVHAVTSIMPSPDGGPKEREFAEAHPIRSTPGSNGLYKGVYTSPDPFKVYGAEFESPDLIRVGRYSCATAGDDGDQGWYVAWKWEFWLTPEQHAQFIKWKTEDPYMSLLDAMSELVPDQVATLPDDLKRYLVDYGYDTIVDGVINSPELLPTPLYSVVGSEYPDDVKRHLSNLGLSTDVGTADLTVTTLPWDGEILTTPSGDISRQTIVTEGNAPDGTRKRWTFVTKVLNVLVPPYVLPGVMWWNADEDRLPTEDEYFLLHVLNAWSGPATQPPVAGEPVPGTLANNPGSSEKSALLSGISHEGFSSSQLIDDTPLLRASQGNTYTNKRHLSFSNNTPSTFSTLPESALDGRLNASTHLEDLGLGTVSTDDVAGPQVREEFLSARNITTPEIASSSGSSVHVSLFGGGSANSQAATLIEARHTSGMPVEHTQQLGFGG
jgi:hypothetical protein